MSNWKLIKRKKLREAFRICWSGRIPLRICELFYNSPFSLEIKSSDLASCPYSAFFFKSSIFLHDICRFFLLTYIFRLFITFFLLLRADWHPFSLRNCALNWSAKLEIRSWKWQEVFPGRWIIQPETLLWTVRSS